MLLRAVSGQSPRRSDLGPSMDMRDFKKAMISSLTCEHRRSSFAHRAQTEVVYSRGPKWRVPLVN